MEYSLYCCAAWRSPCWSRFSSSAIVPGETCRRNGWVTLFYNEYQKQEEMRKDIVDIDIPRDIVLRSQIRSIFSALSRIVSIKRQFVDRWRENRDSFPGDEHARCMNFRIAWNFLSLLFSILCGPPWIFPRSSMNSSFIEACRPTANARSSVHEQGPLFLHFFQLKTSLSPLNSILLLTVLFFNVCS